MALEHGYATCSANATTFTCTVSLPYLRHKFCSMHPKLKPSVCEILAPHKLHRKM